MTLLILGVLLFAGVHLVPALAPGLRAAWLGKMGEGGYKGTFSLLLVASFALMTFGWKTAEATVLYSPSLALRQPGIALLILAFILLVAGSRNSRLRQWVRHPQLTGVLLWAVAHLLMNGDSRSLVLFSGMAIWSCVEIIAISKREGVWIKGDVPSIGADVLTVVIALVAVIAVMFAHPYISGVAVL